MQILGTREERWEKCANICSNPVKFAKTKPNQCELHLDFTADYKAREIQLLEPTIIVCRVQSSQSAGNSLLALRRNSLSSAQEID